MGKQEHLAILRLGAITWNRWRWAHPAIRPDLSYANLQQADLRRADLGSVILAHADLTGADLTNANLREADLSLAKLRGAKLHHAVLAGADLGHVDLHQADLTKAVLSSADLSGVDLRQTNLTGANLFSAKLIGTNISGADLTVIRRHSLIGADLGGADCQQVNLSGTNLGQAELFETDFRRANLRGADFYGAVFRETQLEGADLTAAQLGNTLFVDVDLSEVQGLATVEHVEQSMLDHRTLVRSAGIPAEFLRGCGVPEGLISCLAALQDEGVTLRDDTVLPCRCEEIRELHGWEAEKYMAKHLRQLAFNIEGDRVMVEFLEKCPETGRLWIYGEYREDHDERPPGYVQILVPISADEAAAKFDWSPEASP